jgi:sarcosine oxidase gamma subunit
MRDLAEKWPLAPDWKKASIHFHGTTIGTVSGLSQSLVSGDLDAWGRASGIAETPAGTLSVMTGDRYAVRLARDRILAVSAVPFGIASGWHEEGFAVSTVDTGLHVFEIDGPQMRDILVRATALDPDGGTASAALLFAGVNAFVYRYGSAGCIRVHVDCGLAPYLWQWLEQVCS